MELTITNNLVTNAVPKSITYKGKAVKTVKYNDETIWSINPSIYIYKLIAGYNTPGTTEYNSHNIYYIDSNIDMALLSFTYSGKYASEYKSYFIFCDGLFYAQIINTSGSNGHGNNNISTLTFSYNDFNVNDTKNYREYIYRVGAGYEIDGSYSSKIFHLSPKGGLLKTYLTKYYMNYPVNEVGDWMEKCRKLSTSTTASDVTYYYSMITMPEYWVSATTADATATKVQKNFLGNDTIVTSVDAHNTFAVLNLTLHYNENNTNSSKIQKLGYYISTSSQLCGYMSNTITPSGSAPAYILVLDSINDPYIYWGSYIIYEGSNYFLGCANPYKVVVNDAYANILNNTDTSVAEFSYNFDEFNYATKSTLKNKFNSKIPNLLVKLALVSTIRPLQFCLIVPKQYKVSFNVTINDQTYNIPEDLEQITTGFTPTDNNKLYYTTSIPYMFIDIKYNDMDYTFYKINYRDGKTSNTQYSTKNNIKIYSTINNFYINDITIL